MKQVRGETALVTGGASGIGLGIARALAKAGARVAICDIDLPRAEAAAAELSASGADTMAIALDVTKEDDWQQAAEKVRAHFGDVTILCNNAGVGGGSGLAETYDPSVWDWVFAVNVDSILYSLRTFLPAMKAINRPAYIVNTASMSGLVATPNSIAYVSSKFAAMGFSLALRNELSGSPIGVSVLCPGMTATRIVETTQFLRPGEAEKGIGEKTASAMNTILSTGMKPDNVGQAVLDAILADRFYIFTHPEWKPLVAAQAQEVLNGFGESAQPGHQDDLAGLMKAASTGSFKMR
ncbi:MAG: SDR family oxidoreductase [Alphaproteobacteria bacterium]|nr:SDR family oxidoreductase [Alphaproteobacteria bacterium]